MRSFLMLAIAFSAATFAACSGSSSDSASSAGGTNQDAGDSDGFGGKGSDGGKGPPKSTCQVTAFGSASADFALPNLGAAGSYNPFNMTGGELSPVNTSDNINFATIDIDGDGKLDMVLTGHESDPSVGQSVWKVYQGSGSGFASSSTDFALPNLGATGAYNPFNMTSGELSPVSTHDNINFATIDIDGDGKLDMVLTGRESDPSVGQSVWKVYQGSGSGFASSSADFALPNLGATGAYNPFNMTGGELSPVSTHDNINFATIDIDGDGKLDMVLTGRESDPSVGQSVWKVYKGSGSGFASSSTDFALPNLGATGAYNPFHMTGGELSPVSTHDNINFATIDIDGDGKLDMVLTGRESDPSVGQSVWKVYQGSGSGFASSSADFALPNLGATGAYNPFNMTSGELSPVSTHDNINFATIDIDGDGKLDMVLTGRESDPSVGQSVWKVYRGSGSGFASSSTDFALPNLGATGAYNPFNMTGGELSPVSTHDNINFATIDIDGDGKLDMVLTGRESDPSVGQSVWKVYNGTCK